MKACVVCFAAAGTFLWGQARTQAQLKVEPDERNVVASRLEGEWVAVPALSKRVGGNMDLPISFKGDPLMVNVVPEKLRPNFQKQRIYMAGNMKFMRKHLSPFFLIVENGNPVVVWLREEGDDPYANAESFLVSLVPAKDPANDLLFVGQESIPRPFSVYERKKTKAPPKEP